MDDRWFRLGDHGRYPTSENSHLRFTIANICWAVFCVACVLGIAFANRPQYYQSSSLPELLNADYYTNIAKAQEATSFSFGGGRAGSISGSTRTSGDFQFIASDSFDIQTFVDTARTATNKSIATMARISGSEPIEIQDRLVGFQSEWQTDSNAGLVEIVYIGNREESIDNHPEWSRVYHFRILTIEHKR